MEDNKATWKITCTDEAHTTGEGEITREGDDAFTGTIKFTSDEGNMNLAISAVRAGDCETQPIVRSVLVRALPPLVLPSMPAAR
jgi:hypothetical protein